MSNTANAGGPRPWQFILYRLFSLSGLLPIGGYLCIHLLTNSTVAAGAAPFQKNVNSIHALGPALPFVEWAFIFGPMLFHATVGFMIISGAVLNVGSYPYASNIRYTLQRVTGVLAFLFIVWHILHLHHYGHAVGGGKFDPEHAASSAAVALSPLAIKIIYFIGVTAAVYHFSNGLWTQGITWGIWTSKTAMKRANYVCAAIGVGLFIVGMTSLAAFGDLNVKDAVVVEDRIIVDVKRANGEEITAAPKAETATSSTSSAQ
ncbi:MAG: succinate dehydrogenase [Pirellulales bacterium]